MLQYVCWWYSDTPRVIMFPLDGTLSHITVMTCCSHPSTMLHTQRWKIHRFTVRTLVESNVVVVVLPLPFLPLPLCLHFTISQRETIITIIFHYPTFILHFFVNWGSIVVIIVLITAWLFPSKLTWFDLSIKMINISPKVKRCNVI